MPTGRWVRWWPGTRSLESMPPETQRSVMDAVIGQLGGTAAAAAARLDISSRTVEAWRSGKAPLPIRMAYAIAAALAQK
jgi:FixJ family two-component response regulator